MHILEFTARIRSQLDRFEADYCASSEHDPGQYPPTLPGDKGGLWLWWRFFFDHADRTESAMGE